MSIEVTVRCRWDRWDEVETVILSDEDSATIFAFLQAAKKAHPPKPGTEGPWAAHLLCKYVLPYGIKLLGYVFLYANVAAYEHAMQDFVADVQRILKL